MTQYCKYHPLKPASNMCPKCHIDVCDECVDYNNYSGNLNCYVCKSILTDLGSNNNITPFWRRLEESFRYPMNVDSAMVIIGLSVLLIISMFLPFAFIWFLLLTSALFKYSFSCLEFTAKGDLDAPDLGQVFGGGFRLIFQIIFMVFMVVGMTVLVANYFGPTLASIVGIIFIVGFPAMMINLALTDNLMESINPARMMKIVSAIGMPYGLLLAFIMIMSASVGIINQLISGDGFVVVSAILQSIVSNYYMIVVFHIMGYMIYQFQSDLDFGMADIVPTGASNKTVLQNHITRIDILLKEGEYDEVITLYKEIISQYPEDKNLKPNYFELLLASKNKLELDIFAPQYFNYLLLSNRKEHLPITYKRILQVNPEFMPDSAEQRTKLASICNDNGDARLVVKLINGLYKECPEYDGIISAYDMMASALESLPNMQKQAKTCRGFVNKLISAEKINN